MAIRALLTMLLGAFALASQPAWAQDPAANYPEQADPRHRRLCRRRRQRPVRPPRRSEAVGDSQAAGGDREQARRRRPALGRICRARAGRRLHPYGGRERHDVDRSGDAAEPVLSSDQDVHAAHHDREFSADHGRSRPPIRRSPSRRWSSGPRPIRTRPTTRRRRRPSPSPPNCSSSRPACPAFAITYKSSNEMLLSVIGEQTLLAIADGPPTVPMVKGGKVRALAVTGSVRSSELPDVPSMAEAGYPDVDVYLYSGFFVTAATPPAIAAKLEAALREAIKDPDVSAKLKGMAVNPGGSIGRGIPQDDRRRHREIRRRRQGREPQVRPIDDGLIASPCRRARQQDDFARLKSFGCAVGREYSAWRTPAAPYLAAAIAAKPRSRSPVRSSTSSSPICRRTAGPPGAHLVAVRNDAQSNGVARLS